MSRAAAQQALEALMMMRDKYEEYACPEYACPARDHADAAITTLRKALAEPEQEQPVAWLDIDDKGQKHGLRYYSDGNSDEVPLYTAPTPRKPQTTHWEGCEAVHPECRKPDTDCHAQGICQRSGYSIAPTPRKPEQPYDQTALELCGVCGWRTLIPGDACLNCERSKQPEQSPVAWLITDEKINSLQVASIQRLIDRTKHAHYTDVLLRINGTNERYEADWLKHMTRTAPPQRKPLTDEEITEIWGQKPRWHAPPIGSTDIEFARAVIAEYEAKNGITGETK